MVTRGKKCREISALDAQVSGIRYARVVANRPPMTWAEVGIRNSNFRTTIRAIQFATAWGLATATLGREPESIEEFGQTMEMNRRTAFRGQVAFRAAYPTEDTPGRINRITGAQAKYDDAWRRLPQIGAAEREVEPMTFFLGAAIADV